MKIIQFFIMLSIVFSPYSVANDASNLNLQEGDPIGVISIQGLKRTNKDVVYRELLVNEGGAFSLQDLDESVLRLKNTRLFSKVQMSLTKDKNELNHIVFDLEEKWTIIPVLSASQGGNTTYFVTGLYDYNTAGTFIETGVQYESWNGEPGGVLWFRNPRFLGYRLRFGGDTWYTNRPIELYTQNGASQGRYVLNRRRLNLFLDYEVSRNLTLGFGIDANVDRIRAVESNSFLNQITAIQLESSQKSTSVFSRFNVKLGRINHDSYLLDGAETQLIYAQATPFLGSDTAIYRFEWGNRYFLRVGRESNLGFRLRLSATNSNQLQHLYYVGGFEHIRGYYDGQLRGKQYGQTNVELRLPVVKFLPWAVLQSNLFVDVVKVWQLTGEDDVDNSDVFYSAGIGFRFISPKVYRFIGRLDFALITSHTATSQFSIGAQQFF